MIPRLFNACLLRPSDLQPSRPDFEVMGVFNPGAILTKSGVVLLVHVAERPKERRPGFIALPRLDAGALERAIVAAHARTATDRAGLFV